MFLTCVGQIDWSFMRSFQQDVYLGEQERQQWYQSTSGQLLWQAERSAVQKMLQDSLGFRLVQLDVGSHQPIWQSSSSGSNCLVSLLEARCHCPQVRAHSDALPFQSRAIDVMVMHHSLDFAIDAYASLREVSRCLSDSGCLVLVGFNPGIWSLFKWAASMSPVLKNARFLSAHRVIDWLSLLDLQLESLQWIHPKCGHWFGYEGRDPNMATRACGRYLPWLNACYVIKARKRTQARIPKAALSPLPIGIGRTQFNRERLRNDVCDK